MSSTEKQKASWRKYRSGPKYQRTYWSNHLKRKYGMTIEQYEEMYIAQDKQCKICRATTSLRDWKDGRIQRIPLFVDHNHETGQVRGLLCTKCNTGLAMFNDSEELFVAAINYIRES